MTLPKRGDRLFAEHASPEAIAAHLPAARRAAAREAKRVAWLEDLLARRTAERDAGQWPREAQEGA